MAGVVADLLLAPCVERVASPTPEDSISALPAEGFPWPRSRRLSPLEAGAMIGVSP